MPTTMPSVDSAQPQAPDATDRKAVVDWILRVCRAEALRQTTLFLAVQLVDRYLKAVPTPPPRQYTLLGAAAVLTAAKFEEPEPPAVESLVTVARAQFTAEQVLAMEMRLLVRLGFGLHKPTAAHHLAYVELLDDNGRGRGNIACQLVHYLGELGLYCEGCALWAPSSHGAAAAFLARRLCSGQELHREFGEFFAAAAPDGDYQESVCAIAAEIFRVAATDPEHRLAVHELYGHRARKIVRSSCSAANVILIKQFFNSC